MYNLNFGVPLICKGFILVTIIIVMSFAEESFLDLCPSHRYCRCRETEIRHLSINCENITKMDILPKLLKDLEYLKLSFLELKVYNCTDSYLYGNMFENYEIVVMRMDCPFNVIDKDAFNTFGAVRDLSLRNLNFSLIPEAVGELAYLRELGINFGQLLHIGDELENLAYLETLDLSHNKIETVSKDAFVRNRNIQTFRLSFNRIRFFYPGTFRFCKNIKQFRIDNNRLETTSGIPPRDSLGNLRILILDGNNLTTLPENTLPEETPIQRIGLSDNPWVCDCRLLWLKKLYSNFWIRYFSQYTLQCHRPQKFYGMRLNYLPEKDLIQWRSGCPLACNCTCVSENESFSIKVDCSRRNFSKLPSVFPKSASELDFRDNLLTNPLKLDSTALPTLKILNLERNSLKKLDFVLPENISAVLLANNSITRFFNSPPANVSLWTLSGNAWICDCETRGFRTWMLSEKNKIADINSTLCDPYGPSENLNGKAIVLLSEADLCPSLSIYFTVPLTLLSFVIFGLSTAVLYNHYHYHVKVWLFSRGFTFLKRDMDRDDEKIYDAFVLSADEDFLIVKKYILPELEMKPPFYTLFEPRRDMRAGEMCEYEKELENILKSKRIIVLLSQNYISNNFLMEIFKFAFISSLEEKVFRLILIIVGDLPPLSDDHLSLKAAMDSTRCLRLGDKMFQDMLMFSMPRKQVSQKPTKY